MLATQIALPSRQTLRCEAYIKRQTKAIYSCYCSLLFT